MTKIRTWLTGSLAPRFDALVLSSLGIAGFVGSAGHVLELAETHGQHGTGAWTIVGTIEVLAAYAGIQVQRREGWRRYVALAILTAATTFTIAANLAATLDRSSWGLALSVAPAGVFLAAVVLAETSDRPSRAAAKAAKRERRSAGRTAAVVAGQVATAKTVANVVNEQVTEPMTTEPARPKSTVTDLDRAVLAALTAGQDLGMGEIVMAAGRPKSTVKLAVGRLIDSGQVVSFGDPRRPRYTVAGAAPVEPAPDAEDADPEAVND